MNANFSKIIAGCMTWGQWGKALQTKDIIDLMEYCLRLGITTFDHADIYGGYTTEADFGNAFKQSKIPREQIQLISKCGIQYICESRQDNRVKHYNYSKDYIIWSVEQSLKNLNTDYLDLLLLHRPSPLVNPEEIATAISELQGQGKIKAFGVSNFSIHQINLIRNFIPIQANQIEISLTCHGSLTEGILDHMYTHSIIPMAWSPLGKVFKTKDEQTERIQELLLELIPKYNCSADQLLLAWLLKHPSGIYPVVGTTTKERLVQAIKATELALELQDWFALWQASMGHKVP